jgi:putative transposase
VVFGTMSEKVNQSFIGIPHQRVIEMLMYKAESVGIKVILTEEKIIILEFIT